MRKVIGVLAVAALMSSASSSYAATAQPKPAEIAPVIKSQQPLGSGTMRWLFIPVYDASLWTDATQWSMNKPFALSLTYRMSASGDDIVEHSMKEISHVEPNLSAATLADYRAMLARVFPDVKSGDELTGLYTPDGTVRFFRDGQLTGQVRDAAFAQNFFEIWLSPATSEPGLRAKLLRQS